MPRVEQVADHVDVDVSAISHAYCPLDGPKPTKIGLTAPLRQPSVGRRPKRLRAPNRKPGGHLPFLAESAVLREALGPELYEAVPAVRRAEAELFAVFD
ncbi:hypothetical protein GCM10014715_56110 [Streptomyces spiralis]|uniref:Uncharacterized protein n=1 Tax=Streptomyces spiralis TaxID=66376 RepID=A0A919AAT8_9ACTN|nr:hypothetical protein GCM10014715_56110 [Streptomyces spiralis]